MIIMADHSRISAFGIPNSSSHEQTLYSNQTIPAKQHTYYSPVPLSSSPIPNGNVKPDSTSALWETSSINRCRSFAQPSPPTNLSPRPSHPPPTYEESITNKPLNHHNSKSSIHSPSASSLRGNYFSPHSPLAHISHSLPTTPNQESRDYLTASVINNNHHRSSDTKPPPPVRMPRSNNYARIQTRPIQSYYAQQHQPETTTTYLNTSTLYISQPQTQAPAPPPPPPRYPTTKPSTNPFDPPVIPPRTTNNCSTVTIPNFNCSSKPVQHQTVYRSPIIAQARPTSYGLMSKQKHGPTTIEQKLATLSLVNDKENENGTTIGEYYGECRKCGQSITIVDDACEIMGNVYHSGCCVCVLCGRTLRNKKFLCVKDQLYCEEDFLILQAMGKSYHPGCFRCCVCLTCLDDVPFIVDTKNKIFCLHDYHNTYAPRCAKCKCPICPEEGSNETVRIVSMDQNFHIECYRCEDCGQLLNDEYDKRCYPLNSTLLCYNCHVRRRAL
ncbi:unnamed protein product [Didymodactylos carnosus]|uniref:LIM zinc-binding domain-containing protein n=1 Tax=Didymodactylos carnosus TaxID=1234261 RepID=A0A813VAF2_9BILA|nr:unnamed protein product [Didymodactylos carnosus]CAF0837432.1 unnamed protein product [Didymodactylos carnosus]CAF3532021.1 unnamed protein product [Didymodactylos carnosus]CAF3624681.1 unnamed protein product [Didymodactylos carnosus]